MLGDIIILTAGERDRGKVGVEEGREGLCFGCSWFEPFLGKVSRDATAAVSKHIPLTDIPFTVTMAPTHLV